MEHIVLPHKKERLAPATTRNLLLACGLFSSVLYVLMNILGALLYPGYSSVSQTISELSAVGAPTRPLWVALAAVYTVLVIAFGWGVWSSAGDNHTLRTVGGIIMAYGYIGLGWPFAPMHQREVLAAGGATLSDTMHIVFSVVTVILMLLVIGKGASALGRRFRFYSMATLLLLLIFGVLTGIDAPQLAVNGPTPFIGVWERINVGLYMLWVAVLALELLRRDRETVSGEE